MQKQKIKQMGFVGLLLIAAFLLVFSLFLSQTNAANAYQGGDKIVVLFNKNSDTAIGTTYTQTLELDTTTRLRPNQYVNEGYQFMGWARTADGNVFFEDEQIIATPANNIVLFAVWEALPKIEFDANGGEGEVVSVVAGSPAPSGDGLTYTGYTFWFWVTSEGAAFFEGDPLPNEACTLYAEWMPVFYNIDFDANGGEGTIPGVPNVMYSERVTLPRVCFRKTGYIQVGWEFDVVGGTKEVPLGAVVEGLSATDGATVVVRALYEDEDNRTPQYTISFAENGGQLVLDEVCKTGMVVDVRTKQTARHGYDFVGWTNEAGAPVTEVVVAEEDVTLYAKWQPRQFVVKYDTKGGIPVTIEDKTVAYEASVPKPTAPTRSGYHFVGWYQGDTATEPFVFDAMPLGNITLEARWELAVYALSFAERDETELLPTQNVAYGAEVALPSPEKRGYQFLGWFRDALLTDAASKPYHMSNGDATLYAKWSPIVYKVSFDTDKAGVLEDVSFTIENPTFALPKAPTKEGFVFDNWYTNQACTILFDAAGVELKDITLYAKWNEEIEKEGFPAWAIAVICVVGVLIIAGGIGVGFLVKKREQTWNN